MHRLFFRQQSHAKLKLPPLGDRAGAVIVCLSIWLAWSACAQTSTFDFDTGTPALTTGQNVPFLQTSSGATARFSAVAGGFSIQNDASTMYSLSAFSGNYLYFNSAGSVLQIQFSQDVTNIAFNFATADFPPIEFPTPIRLTAYTNSTQSPAVGTITASGTYGADTLPMGIMNYTSATPFNIVTLNIEPGGGIGFLMDNIAIQTSAANNASIVVAASPSNAGSTTGSGTYTRGANVTVVANPSPGYAFLAWTENGVSVSQSATYTFAANDNRWLVATFVPGSTILATASPVKGGVISGAGSYIRGSNATLVASPNPGYAFFNWTDGGVQVSKTNSYTFTVSTNRTVVANFAPLLQVTRTNGTNILLSWDAYADGFAVQSVLTCNGTNWCSVTNIPGVVGGVYQLSLPASTNANFFRLFHP